MHKIVVPDDWPPVLAASPSFRRLRESAQVEYFDTLPASEESLIERIRTAQVVLNIRSSCRFSETVFQACPQLSLVSIWGTGTDNVDLDAAKRHGVRVANTPGVAAASVAEHALSLMLAVARAVPAQDAAVRAGRWPRGQSLELRGKTLGVVGLGAIGRRFAQLGRAIGMEVVAWTMHPDPALGFEIVDLEVLLSTSDVVSLHVRLSARTEKMVGAREFGLMKPGAILVNTARGAIVHEEALIEALRSGRIHGAGLDVFTTEPLPARHPLTTLPNVVLSPHSAGITPEALEAGLAMAVSNALSLTP